MPNKRAPGQVTLSISMPRSLLSEMDQYCVRADITKSQYIRRLIREDAARYGSEVPVAPVADHAAVEGCPRRLKNAAS
jgi:hypothetical protein